LKLLVVSEYEYGPGAAVAAWRLAQSLAAPGVEVHYGFHFPARTAPDPGPVIRHQVGTPVVPGYTGLRGACLRAHQYITFRETTAPNGGARLLWGAPSTLSRRILLNHYYGQIHQSLTDLLDTVRPDVVNLHNIPLMLDHSFVERLSHRLPVIWTLHDCHAVSQRAYEFAALDGTQHVTPRSLMSIHKGAPRRLALRAGNLTFVAPSQWLGAIAHGIARKQAVHVVPYGLNPVDFHPVAKSDARRQLAIPDDGRLTLLFVASSLANERKNLRALLEALRLEPDLPVRLLCLGEAPPDADATDPRVQYLAPRFTPAELRVVYAAADLFIITSLIDNLPNTVMESLFCGTPVLGANTGGIPDMVVPGQSGWLFDPRSPADLARHLKTLAADPAPAHDLAARCAPWAVERYHEHRQRDRYLQIIAEAMAPKPPEGSEP
jgi:glycosyltransferase involved in cell wall biosynthesis